MQQQVTRARLAASAPRPLGALALRRAAFASTTRPTTQQQQQQRRRARGASVTLAAAAGGPGGSGSSSGGGDASKRQQQADLLLASCPVPRDQQPIFELQQLTADASFDLARQPLPAFALRLARDFAVFFALAGLPVSAFTFDPWKEPAQCLLSAAAGSLFIVTVLVWRLYLGWDHVGSRLQSATVEYEETGWYDGQIWVKSPEVLARDRLAVAYQTRPAIARLRAALLGLGGALATSVVLLAALPPPQAQSQAEPYAAAVGAGAQQQQRREALDYEERLQRFEPWALDDESGSRAEAAPSLLDHMRSA